MDTKCLPRVLVAPASSRLIHFSGYKKNSRQDAGATPDGDSFDVVVVRMIIVARTMLIVIVMIFARNRFGFCPTTVTVSNRRQPR